MEGAFMEGSLYFIVIYYIMIIIIILTFYLLIIILFNLLKRASDLDFGRAAKLSDRLNPTHAK